MLNWNIMKEPFNWVTVLLMVIFGGILINLILTPLLERN